MMMMACCLLTGVGKTCLLLRYANDSFSPTFITTIGIDFKVKTVETDGKRIKLQVNLYDPGRGAAPADVVLLCRFGILLGKNDLGQLQRHTFVASGTAH